MIKFECPFCGNEKAEEFYEEHNGKCDKHEIRWANSKISDDMEICFENDLVIKREIWQCGNCDRFFMPIYELKEIKKLNEE